MLSLIAACRSVVTAHAVIAILALTAPVAIAQSDGAVEAEGNRGESDYQSQLNALQWVEGPQRVDTAGNSSLDLPADFLFLPRAEAEKFMRLNENPTYGEEMQVFAPNSLQWFAVVTFSADGYVKDDEEIDKDAILQSVSEGTEAGNAERVKNGWSEMHVVGWSREPYYDQQTNHLEWAIDSTDGQGATWTNFQSRILGRRGVASVVLVTDPTHIDADMPAFKQVLTGFRFNDGDTYAEFKEGDMVAEYGLAALIAGGAAAAAAKTGILKSILKFGWLLIIPVIVFAKSIFAKIFGRSRNIGS